VNRVDEKVGQRALVKQQAFISKHEMDVLGRQKCIIHPPLFAPMDPHSNSCPGKLRKRSVHKQIVVSALKELPNFIDSLRVDTDFYVISWTNLNFH